MYHNRKYCPECQVGVFRMEAATYYTWIADELVTVQDFPCWVCDVCGHREWDQKALMNLNLILSPNAGTPTQKRRPVTGEAKPETKKRRRSIG